MATWDKAKLRNRTLEYMGIKAATQSAASEDANDMDELIDSEHAQLRHDGLALFETSAVPEYAQRPMIEYLAAVAGPGYGLPGGPELADQRRMRLARQEAGRDEGQPTKANYF